MDLALIEKQLKEKDIAMIIIPKLSYTENVMDIVRVLTKSIDKLCYVSANKPEKTLVKMLTENNIDPEKVFIVDCLSESSERKKGKTIYVRSPANLTEINLSIKEMINQGASTVFIDAISTLMIYEQGIVVIRFAHNLITKLREINKKCVFIVMEGDINRALIDDLDMFVDFIYEHKQ